MNAICMLGAVLAAGALSGCAASWGFTGHVGEAPLDGSGAITPLPRVTVTCDGCPGPVAVRPDGSFGVGFGASYDPPPPARLRFSAPGYEPVDLVVERSPMVGQAGPVNVVVLLRRHEERSASAER